MAQKLSVLRACRRVLRPGGRIAYFTIFVSEDLPPGERRNIGKVTPAGVFTPASQQGLLRSASFVHIQQTDVTDEYVRVQRALYAANARHARSLRRSQGAEQFDEQQRNRELSIERTEAGAVRRSLFVAMRPKRGSRR